MQGDQVYLARGVPSVELINEKSAWEFYAGKDDDGKDQWVAGDLSKVRVSPHARAASRCHCTPG